MTQAKIDVRVFLFDIDGTLLSTKGVGRGALSQAMLDEFGVAHPDSDVVFSGRTDRSLLMELLQRNGLEVTEEHCRRLRDRYVSLMGGHLARQGGVVLPGIRALLTDLFRRDALELAVMTGNLPETATQKLAHFDLRQWFAWISGGSLHVERDDLARRTAEIIARRYGNSVTEVVVVGDTPADIRCGHAIGAKTIAVATGEFSIESLTAENPTKTFADFSQTDEVLAALL
ncbi:HAD family hydrolase [Allorhodopirellula heiligendammensis]|uniref:phosphoglycolate phosphatase n=1 Tax=Allorhodopirellula heiligendammensis TaxID=2714739 RepID=A0A5C6BTM9_9BACT|nr:HAD family hydrolase [Allorhodopirellula heiligendammensis]TWU15378.1 Phosphoglycolate phosphatase [Allorhodopirellula heiligendammensis]